MEDRQQDVYQAALDLFSKDGDWVDFFREILGVHGKMRRTFTKKQDLAAFQQTTEFRGIQQMLATLRKKKPNKDSPQEESRVITVRLPKDVHAALTTEAHDRQTSVNRLCISKLLQTIDQELVPSDETSPEGSTNGSGERSGAQAMI